MKEAIVVQGRRLEPEEISEIDRLIRNNPEWSRRRISEVLAAEWDWRNAAGRLKDMATRSLLLKLDERGLIKLPPRRRRPSSRMAGRQIKRRDWDRRPIRGKIRELGPITVEEVGGDREQRDRLGSAWAEFHYLGYRGTVGENLQYRVMDKQGRLLAALLFGSAAWKCAARDGWIGWNAQQRRQSLQLITNNMRFLILPWVEVRHLASWVLSRVLRRLSADWEGKYGHPILLVETYVERQRFAGTCYRAANWVPVGTTTGRSRQDRDHTIEVPAKDIYLYPLRGDFRHRLCS